MHAQDTIARLGNGVLGSGDKRPRDDKMDEDERQAKKEKTVDDDDDDGEEMEIEEDEEPGAKGKNGGMPYSLKVSHMVLTSGAFYGVGVIPPVVHQPSTRLLCTNLPQEVTDDVLSVLFQQYVMLLFFVLEKSYDHPIGTKGSKQRKLPRRPPQAQMGKSARWHKLSSIPPTLQRSQKMLWMVSR